jgi:hypothetical protein
MSQHGALLGTLLGKALPGLDAERVGFAPFLFCFAGQHGQQIK